MIAFVSAAEKSVARSSVNRAPPIIRSASAMPTSAPILRGLITRARSKKRCAWISKAVETPEELIDELMGHTTGKPKYRDGYGLKLKLKYLQAIALTPPPGTLRAAA